MRIICTNSMQVSTHLADRNDLKFSIGLVTRFTSPVLLLNDVIQTVDLPHDDGLVACGIDLIHGRLDGAALVHGDLLGNTADLHDFAKKRMAAALSR